MSKFKRIKIDDKILNFNNLDYFILSNNFVYALKMNF